MEELLLVEPLEEYAEQIRAPDEQFFLMAEYMILQLMSRTKISIWRDTGLHCELSLYTTNIMTTKVAGVTIRYRKR